MNWNETEKQKLSALILNAKVTGDTSWYKKVIVSKIVANKDRYKAVADLIGCPLAMVPIIHCREMGSDVGVFKAYLGNGQPINKVTTIVPKGRGPFTSWESGAIDALKYDGVDKVTGWTLERMLFELEGFNGYGYRSKGIHSPYIWNFTNHYKAGLFYEDHKYSATKVDGNIGCFALYKLLKDFFCLDHVILQVILVMYARAADVK